MKRSLLCGVFLLCAHIVLADPIIFIVRHAEKGEGDPKDPMLSHPGQHRAEWLAATLKDSGITAIYATEFKRTQETAAPLSRAIHVDVTTIPANDTATLVSKLKQTHGNALVVAHSNTIPEILKACGLQANVTIDDNDYTNLFILSLGPTPGLARMRLALESDD